MLPTPEVASLTVEATSIAPRTIALAPGLSSEADGAVLDLHAHVPGAVGRRPGRGRADRRPRVRAARRALEGRLRRVDAGAGVARGGRQRDRAAAERTRIVDGRRRRRVVDEHRAR